MPNFFFFFQLVALFLPQDEVKKDRAKSTYFLKNFLDTGFISLDFGEFCLLKYYHNLKMISEGKFPFIIYVEFIL